MTMTTTRIDRGSTATTTIYSEGGELVFERRFAAPRSLVWRAFTDPDLVPRWWGKHGSTTEVEEMDVRPGGRWRYISRAADRDDIAFHWVKGHSGDEMNDLVDRMAVEESARARAAAGPS